MYLLLPFLVIVCLDIAWRMRVSGRMAELEVDIGVLRDTRGEIRLLERTVQGLARRVASLERQPSVSARPEEEAAPEPVASPAEAAIAVVESPDLTPPPTSSEHGAFSWASPEDADPMPQAVPAAISDSLRPVEQTLAAMPHAMPAAHAPEDEDASGTQARDWETLIGGDWLNKLGALVLVIGISLFVGYSLTRVGPLGRVGIGFAASAILLALGVRFERQGPYVLFGRALIGGGWAGTYFTAYAMHALDAARVVTSPLIATVALAGVAAAIILHSLRYRSQTATGLAYFIGFVTLALTPSTTFALVATLPLSATLILVAQRFQWTSSPIVALIGCYGSMLVRTGADPSVDFSQFVREQSVVAVAWLMFEAFDIATERRDPNRARYLLFPLNVCGLIGVSLLKWPRIDSRTLSVFFGIAAAAYLASAIARALLVWSGQHREPDASAAAADDRPPYRAPVTIAAVLVVPAILLRFSGLQINIAFLLAAEFLFFAAVQTGDRYLSWLSAPLLALPVVKALSLDPLAGDIAVGGITILRGTPVAVMTAAVLYLNQGLRRDDTRATHLPLAESWYRFAAAALLTSVVGREAPHEYVGVCWTALGFVLSEAGLRRRISELRVQGYLAGTLGLAAFAAINLASLHVGDWLPVTLAAVLAYGWATRLASSSARHLDELDAVWRIVCAIAGTIFAAAAIWTVTPMAFVGPAWLLFAIVLFGRGLSDRWPGMRGLAYPVAAMGASHALSVGVFAAAPQYRLTLAAAALLLEAVALRLRYLPPEGLDARERTVVGTTASWIGLAFLASLQWHTVPSEWIGVVWAATAVAMLALGRTMDSNNLRYQSLAMSIVTFVRHLDAVGHPAATIAGLPVHIVAPAAVVALLYAAHAISRNDAARVQPSLAGVELQRLAGFWSAALSIMATTLLAVLLYREMSSGMLTVAWAVEGMALLTAGFVAGDRVLRRSGLVLLALCTVKVFAYDFRQLDTLSRIVSFIVLGILLLLASWAYARYSDRVRKFL